MQDRFTKVMLVIIAALLVFNMFRNPDRQLTLELPDLANSAQAQSARTLPAAESSNTTYRIRTVEGKKVTDIINVIAVGDGKSFVVSNSNGFMVYQLTANQ